jgi:hypothetical protein
MPIILLGQVQTKIKRDSGYLKQFAKGSTPVFGGTAEPIHIETGFIVNEVVVGWTRLRELDIGILYNFGEGPDNPPEIKASYYSNGRTGFKLEYDIQKINYPNGYIISADYLCLG